MYVFTRVEVVLHLGPKTLTRVVEATELAAFLHTATRVGWTCVSVEWTELEVTA